MTDQTCTRCGRTGFMGGTINQRPYCHGSSERPSCYELASRYHREDEP